MNSGQETCRFANGVAALESVVVPLGGTADFFGGFPPGRTSELIKMELEHGTHAIFEAESGEFAQDS